MSFDASFVQAFEKTYDEDFDEYMSSLEQRSDHVFSEKHEKKMAKLIKRQRKPYFRFICTAGRRAACIAAATVVFSSTALGVYAVRNRAFDLSADSCSDHDVIKATSDSSDYPEIIEKEYYISELPNGYRQTEYNKTDNWSYSEYRNGNKRIVFEQCTKKSFKLYIDNEYCTSESYIDTDGVKYIIKTFQNGSFILWDNGEYIMTLSSNLDKNAALKLCKSTKVK